MCDVQEISYRSFALDDGNYTISEDEYNEIISNSLSTKQFLRPFIGGRELLRSIKRYCVWLLDKNPSEIKKDKIILEKINKVKIWRENSIRPNTKKWHLHQRYLLR